jgi:hypothetical protein
MLQTDINSRVNRFSLAARTERLLPPQIVQPNKAVRHPIFKIFEVQSSATGQGVYNCYEQKIVSSNWDNATGSDKFADKSTTEIQVLNLNENDPVAAANYWPALAKYDRIKAQQIHDDRRLLRWAGIPIAPPNRLVKATENAPHTLIGGSGNTVTCNLLLNNGSEASSGELGYNIEVNGRSSPNNVFWDDAVPIIISGVWYHAYCKHGAWYFTDTFMLSCVGDNVICG